jgi:hypothetical protein
VRCSTDVGGAAERRPAAGVLGGHGYHRDSVGTGLQVGPYPVGDLLGSAEGGQLLGQFQWNRRSHVRSPRATAGPLDEFSESELAEHLSVAGWGQVDRELTGQLPQRRLTGPHRDR